MANVLINENTMSAIGDAIRGKTGKEELIFPAEMVGEIEGIKISKIVQGSFIGPSEGEYVVENAFTFSTPPIVFGVYEDSDFSYSDSSHTVTKLMNVIFTIKRTVTDWKYFVTGAYCEKGSISKKAISGIVQSAMTEEISGESLYHSMKIIINENRKDIKFISPEGKYFISGRKYHYFVIFE